MSEYTPYQETRQFVRPDGTVEDIVFVEVPAGKVLSYQNEFDKASKAPNSVEAQAKVAEKLVADCVPAIPNALAGGLKRYNWLVEQVLEFNGMTAKPDKQIEDASKN